MNTGPGANIRGDDSRPGVRPFLHLFSIILDAVLVCTGCRKVANPEVVACTSRLSARAPIVTVALLVSR
jgi:hypothetical protein